jgi:hypothetical protein
MAAEAAEAAAAGANEAFLCGSGGALELDLLRETVWLVGVVRRLEAGVWRMGRRARGMWVCGLGRVMMCVMVKTRFWI